MFRSHVFVFNKQGKCIKQLFSQDLVGLQVHYTQVYGIAPESCLHPKYQLVQKMASHRNYRKMCQMIQLHCFLLTATLSICHSISLSVHIGRLELVE